MCPPLFIPRQFHQIFTVEFRPVAPLVSTIRLFILFICCRDAEIQDAFLCLLRTDPHLFDHGAVACCTTISRPQECGPTVLLRDLHCHYQGHCHRLLCTGGKQVSLLSKTCLYLSHCEWRRLHGPECLVALNETHEITAERNNLPNPLIGHKRK